MKFTYDFLSLPVDEVNLISTVAKLDRDEMLYFWSEDAWQDFCRYGRQEGMIGLIKKNEEVVGFGLWHIIDERRSELLKIAVKTCYRGHEVALGFWLAAVLELKKLQVHSCVLEVDATNLRALAFYRKVGFTTLATRKSFYSNGRDAISLICEI